MQDKLSEDEIKEILQKYKTIAVIGCSRESGKDAHIVPAYLKKHGYMIIPINPFAKQIFGEKAYPTILDIPEKLAEGIEIIEVFRPRQEANFFVKQAIEFKEKSPKSKLKIVWLQEGIFLTENEKTEIENMLKKLSLTLIQNRCMMREHGKLFHRKSKEQTLEEGIKIVEEFNKILTY